MFRGLLFVVHVTAPSENCPVLGAGEGIIASLEALAESRLLALLPVEPQLQEGRLALELARPAAPLRRGLRVESHQRYPTGQQAASRTLASQQVLIPVPMLVARQQMEQQGRRLVPRHVEGLQPVPGSGCHPAQRLGLPRSQAQQRAQLPLYVLHVLHARGQLRLHVFS